MQITDTLQLINGVKIPQLGFGTYQLKEGTEVEQAVQWALETGYRHIDTATIYRNERGVGNAIKSSGVPRDQIFVTTKVWNDAQRNGYDAVLKAFDESMSKLQLDVLDLYLVHWAIPGMYTEAWRALEHLYEQKRVRAIGVSNFYMHHLNDVFASAKVQPMVNQIELHPRLIPIDVVELCKQKKIIVEAWSPLMAGRLGELKEVAQIAERHGKTSAQVVLRWNLQHGWVTIPKSARKERIEENTKLYDFELSAAEMTAIDGLDQQKRIGPHPDKVNF